jgi:hypothetical protein
MKNIKTYEELDNGKLLKDIKKIGRKVSGNTNKFLVDKKYLTPLELINTISHPAIERVELEDISVVKRSFGDRPLDHIKIHIKPSSIQNSINIKWIESIYMYLIFDQKDSYPYLASNSYIEFDFSKEVPEEYLSWLHTSHLSDTHVVLNRLYRHYLFLQQNNGKEIVKFIKDNIDDLDTIVDRIKNWFKENQGRNKRIEEEKNKIQDFNKVSEYFEDCLYGIEEISVSYHKDIKKDKFVFTYNIPGIKVRNKIKKVSSSHFSSWVEAHFDEASLIMTDELASVFKLLGVAKSRMLGRIKDFEMVTNFKNDTLNVIIEYKSK